MKLSALSETLNIQGRLNSRDEPLHSAINRIKFKLTNLSVHFDRAEAEHQLNELRELLKAIPVDEPKVDWESVVKQELIDDVEYVCHNLDAKELHRFVIDFGDRIYSLTKDARSD